jgi:hypothetical protein
MSSVSGVSSTTARCPQPVSSSAADGGLPPPSVPMSVEDVTAVLLVLEGRTAEGSTDSAKAQIESASAKQAEARARMREALREAAEQEEDGSFWDKVTSSLSSVSEIAVVAAAAASVVTGGASLAAYLALAGATMSMSSTVGREVGLDPTLCKGLALGGLALSLGSGVAAGAGGALQADAASKAVSAGSTGSGLSMGDAARALRAAGGTARVGAGATGMVAGNYHSQAARSDADALEARHCVSRYDDVQKDQIERLDEIAKSAASALSELIDIQATAHASAMAVIYNFGRRS